MGRVASKARRATPKAESGRGRTQPPHPTPSLRLLAVLLIAVAAFVLLAHWPALSARAISFDDTQYVIDNYLVRNPSWLSTQRFLGEVFHPSTVRGYYQPLTMISLMVDCSLGGGPDNLRPFHRTSLAFHVANTAMVIVLLYVLFGEPWVAAMAGLLFGVHPMTVEPIPWLGERKTVLATFFVLWALLSYVRYTRTRHRAWYGLALAAFVLALMSKPTSTPLPAMLLLLDYWPLRRLSWRAVLEKMPFFAVSAVFAVITYVSQSRTGGALGPGDYPLARIPLTLCHNIVFYLYKIVWPVRLSSHYPFPSPFDLSNPKVLAGVIGTCLLLPALLLSVRWTRAALTGWLFFFVAIVPAMGIIGFTNVIASDKYAYLPAIGLLLPLAALLVWLWRPTTSAPGHVTGRRTAIVAGVFILVGLETWATRYYLAKWQDSETLATYMLTQNPDDAFLHHNLATVLYDEGKVDDAVRRYAEALHLDPAFADAHDGLGRALARQGRLDQAIAHYTESLRLNPSSAEAHSNLANALLRRGRIDEAIERYKEAIRLRPAFPGAHNNRANALAGHGRLDEAIEHYNEAIRLSPVYLEAHINLANALVRQGRLDTAIEHYEQVLRLKPAFPEVHSNLANALAAQGRLDEAVRHYRNAIQIDPALAGAHRGLAMILERQGKYDEALREYQETLRLNPHDEELRNRLRNTFPMQAGSKPS